ncbi:MAG TPA: transglycosylase domain-containing protein [Candidatus Nitrosocosmicus sp.]|nr:transglycosylase domain-containing protein [Candidatus Nitrosocosmicus sp.]
MQLATRPTRRLSLNQRNTRQKLLMYVVVLMIATLMLMFIGTVGIFAWYSKDLPSPGKVQRTSGYSTVFLDRDGKVIYELYKDQNRIPVTHDQVSDYVKKATVAIEDKNFYKHKGFSPWGMFRGVIINTLRSGRATGGSTLTQQLIKNAVLTSERSINRKIKEFILSSEIERRYSKDEIITMYLNEAPYGGAYWGVESASKGYFGKSAKDLNLIESAILAGLPQQPSYYSPYIGEEGAYKGRTKDVLRRMREDGYITKDQEKKALADLNKIKFTSPKVSITAPHFIFYVRDQIVKMYGEKILDSGLRIKTTLSLDDQKDAEKIVSEEIEKIKSLNATNGSLVAIDSKSGEIRAMVGSYDYNDTKYGKFNTALAQRQPGSAVKPITYALAFEKGYTPSTVLMDLKTSFPIAGSKDYSPVNYDGKFRGPVQLRFALGNSLNIHAVKLLAMVGIKDFMQKAYDMGLDTMEPTQANLDRYGLSLTLGGGDSNLLALTSAFSVFARGGERKDPISILEIKDIKGKTIFKSTKPKSKRVLSEGSSYLISHILSDNNARIDAFGPSSLLRIPNKTVAVKTGTTDDKGDNWAIGYTKDITVGVWVGNNDNSAMNSRIASGVTGASPIWSRAMKEYLTRYSDGFLDKPSNVEAHEIDSYLGGLPHEGNAKRSEYFIKGTEPKEISPFYKKLKISKNNGKLANELEIKQGQYEEKDFIVITENDPVSSDGKNRWQEAIEEWRKAQTDEKFKYPTETSDSSADSVVVSIKSPGDRSTVNSNDIEIKAKITSGFSLRNIKLFINGSESKSIDGDSKEFEATVRLSDGVYELKITARNEKDKTGESTIKFGVNRPWDYTPPTSAPTSAPTVIQIPTSSPIP